MATRSLNSGQTNSTHGFGSGLALLSLVKFKPLADQNVSFLLKIILSFSDAFSDCVSLVGRLRVSSRFSLSACANLPFPAQMAFGHCSLSLRVFTGYPWSVLVILQFTKLSFHDLGVPKMGSPFFSNDFALLGVFPHACVRFLAFGFPFLFGKLPFVGGHRARSFTV